MSEASDIEFLRSTHGIMAGSPHYQAIPDLVAAIVDACQPGREFQRFERERMAFFSEKLNFSGMKVLDVGGNTGYFSFGCLHSGAQEVVCYEGSREPSEFVRVAARLFDKNVRVRQEYMTFDGPIEGGDFDIALLLNVLHHPGSNSEGKAVSADKARDLIIRNLNYFSDKVRYMIFQIGFNWMSDGDDPLFKDSTKEEMIDMLARGIEGHWSMTSIGIAEVVEDGTTVYKELGEATIPRNDAIGEFRERPIFILKSRTR